MHVGQVGRSPTPVAASCSRPPQARDHLLDRLDHGVLSVDVRSCPVSALRSRLWLD